jgi:hypothetical protein
MRRDLLSIDLRSLAAFRVSLGVLLLADLAFRGAHLSAFYADEGVLPRDVLLAHFGYARTWSVHLISGHALVQALLFAVAGASALALAAGYSTRLATFASWFLLLSAQHRQPLTATGGDVLLTLLLFWSLFLPLGAFASLDARRAGGAPRGGGFVRSPGSAALLAQVALVYLFAAIFKLLDPAWQQLAALERSFSVEGVATDLARFLLRFPDLLRAATLVTLALECAAPLLLFCPWRTARVRVATVAALWAFHLLGTGTTMRLGLIEYVMATSLVPFLPGAFWERVLPVRLARASAPNARAATSRLADAAAALLLAVAVADNVASLDRGAERRLVPAPLRVAIESLGLSQNWQLWSTPLDNRYYVFAARLADGSEVDLHTGRALDWERPRRRSRNNHWWKYQLHLSRPYAARLRPHYAAYLEREWNRGEPPERRVERLELVELDGPWDADPARLPRTRLWP